MEGSLGRKTGVLGAGHMPFGKILFFALAGVIIARFWVPTATVQNWLQLLLLLGFVYLVIVFFVFSVHHTPWSLVLQLWMSVAFYYLASKDEIHLVPNHFSHFEATWFLGRVLSEPVIKNNRARFSYEVRLAATDSGIQKVNGRIKVNLPISGDSSFTPLKYFDYILLPAVYKPVPPPGNPEELDYRFHLIKENIWFQSYLNENDVYKTYETQQASITGWSLAVREAMVRKMGVFVKDPAAFAIASTLILGYRAELSPDILQIFSVTGTIHVLSVSGMHVVLVFLLFDRLLWWLQGSKTKNIGRYLILIGSIWLYALISGLSPSVLRASAMLSFVLVGKGVGRKGNMYNSLCVSAFFILCFSPKLLWDLGFQLSYLAVFFIVFCQDIWTSVWEPTNKWVKAIWSYSGMSISAQMGSGPLAVFYFKQFPVYFLFANLLIALPSTAIMYLGFLLLLSPSDILSGWIGELLQFTILAMNSILKHIAKFPYSSMMFRSLSFLEIICIYGVIVVLICWYRTRTIAWIRRGVIFLLVLAISTYYEVKERTLRRRVVVHHVGNNLAITYASLDRVYVYTNLEDQEASAYSYNVLPYVRDIQMGRPVSFINTGKDFIGADLLGNDHILWFPDFILAIWDRTSKSKLIEGPIQILLLRQNAMKGLEDLLKSGEIEMLVIDSSNSERTIESVLAWCRDYGQRYYVLKNNFAYFWELKDHKSCIR